MTIRTFTAIAGAAVLGLGLAACGNGTNGANDTGAADTDGTAPAAAGGTITLGYLPAWTDGLSTAYLLDNKLTAAGYTVEHTEVSEAALLYAGLANGDIDIYPSAWPEATHSAYMEQYQDQIDDLGTYYDNAQLTFAVPDYVQDVNTIEDLVGQGDRFGGRIVGIEPGAGLTRVTQDEVIPQYDLGGEYELVTSSTTAMLAELQQATQNQQDIVVTLWRPFWANATFPVKDLEDPKGALGGSEGLHFLATNQFRDEFPQVADWIGGLTLDDEQFGTLEDKV
ncbi:MAG: glycine betaine ABC transporter substrate-binding protein, partial [Mobilicoccus sp.]|nr:glycine betaine ABC transporter substrate-binding protein [Mobilicoccus sp.]